MAPSAAVHLGVAISLRQGGLVAPALHDADRLGLDELMRAFRDLVQRARAGTLRSSELSDPTITVTSLGEQGVETVFGDHLPAAGGDRRLRQDRASGRGWSTARSSRGPWSRYARRRPPRDRRPSRRPLSRPRSTACCRSRQVYDARRDPRHRAARPRRDRARGRPRRAPAGPGAARRSSTSTRWTS